MDKVTITFVTVTASVILSVAAVTVAAQSGLFAPPPSPTGKTVDASDQISALEERIEMLSDAIQTPAVAGDSTNVGIDPELAGKVTHLETENASLHRKVEALETALAELQNRPVAPVVPSLSPEAAAEVESMAGTPSFDAQVERVIEERTKRLERDRRIERRDEAKKSAEDRIPRMVEFMGGRMELDETQQAMVSEALISFEQQRQDLEYMAWEQDWSREETQAQTTALWETTQASLQSAGLTEEQTSGLSRLSRMGGGGRQGGRGGAAFGGGGNNSGGGGFGGRGGRGGGR